MRKLSALFALLMTFGMGALAHAHVENLWIDADVNAEIPMNDDLDTTVYISGSLGYDLSAYFAVYAEAGWREFDFSDIDADVTSVPVLFNVRYTFAPDAQWSPYVFGGLGISLNDINASGADIDDSFAGQVGGGAEYYVNECLAIYAEARIFLSNPDTSESILGHESLDLNSVSVGGGVRYDF